MLIRHLIIYPYLLLAVGCASLAANPDQTKSDLEDRQRDTTVLIASGDQALNENDIDTAQIKYSLVIEREPNNVDVLFKLGLIHNLRGSLVIAESLLRRVLRINNKHQGSHEILGLVLLKQERLIEAEKQLYVALEARPDSWQVLNALGVIKDINGEHLEAQENFTAALYILPHAAKIENNLGYSYYLVGDMDKAEHHFRRAINIDQNYLHAWSNLGLLFSRQHRYSDAKAAFNKVVTEHQAANNLGYLGLMQNDNEMAKEQFKLAIRLAPSYYGIAKQNLVSLENSPTRTKDISVGNNQIDEKQRSSEHIRTNQSATKSVIGSTGNRIEKVRSVALKRPAVDADVDAMLPKKSRPDSSPDQVRLAQRYLNFLGYAAGSVDGKVGDKTSKSLISFQASNNLDVNGHLDTSTRNLLFATAITKVQNRLLALGYNPGAIDGSYGSSTKAAIMRFQENEQLPATGKISQDLLSRLGQNMVETKEPQPLDKPDVLELSATG